MASITAERPPRSHNATRYKVSAACCAGIRQTRPAVERRPKPTPADRQLCEINSGSVVVRSTGRYIGAYVIRAMFIGRKLRLDVFVSLAILVIHSIIIHCTTPISAASSGPYTEEQESEQLQRNRASLCIVLLEVCTIS